VRLRAAADELRGFAPSPDKFAAKKLRVGGPRALVDYQREKNARSIDGLPAVELPEPPAVA
jgi:hypothetical protein